MKKTFLTLLGLLVSIQASENVGYLTNQKYVCIGTQVVIGKKVMNYQTQEEALNYPIRFYIDDNNILRTDGKINNYYTHKKDLAYESKDSVMILEVKDNIRYLYNARLQEPLKGAIYVFKCVETDSWTLGR